MDAGEGLRFEVPLRPVPKQSFRFSKRGGYQPARITKFKKAVAQYACVAKQQSKWVVNEVPVLLRLEFHFAWPTNTKKAIKQTTAHRQARPDLDNLEKAVVDGMDCLWPDDSYVAAKVSSKFNSPENKIIIIVEKIDETKRLASLRV